MSNSEANNNDRIKDNATTLSLSSVFDDVSNIKNINDIFSSYNRISSGILSFFEVHEVIHFLSLNSTLHKKLNSPNFLFEHENVILSYPWDKCPKQLRSKYFSIFSGIKSLRIEPIISSILVLEDLKVILNKSTDTIEYLYICTPSGSLILDMTDVEIAFQRTRMQSNSFEAFDHISDQSLKRCLGSDYSTNLELGCYYFNPSLIDMSYTFSSLIHLEITGNDAFLWAWGFSNCIFSSLKYITLQVWTSSYNMIDKQMILHLHNDPKYSDCCCNYNSNHEKELQDIEYEVVDLGIVPCCFLEDNAKQADDNLLYRRTYKCLLKKEEMLSLFIKRIRYTVVDFELVLPGRSLDFNLLLSCSSFKNILSQDINSHTAVVESEGAGNINDRNEKAVEPVSLQNDHSYISYLYHQYQLLTDITKKIIYYEKFMYLEKLHFLGHVSVEIGFLSLISSLQDIYNEIELSLDYLEKFVDKIDQFKISNHKIPVNFHIEPEQPILPILDFEIDLDKVMTPFDVDEEYIKKQYSKIKHVHMSEFKKFVYPFRFGKLHNSTSSAQSKDSFLIPIRYDSNYSFSNILFVFTGLFNIPDKSCIEFDFMYPSSMELVPDFYLKTTQSPVNSKEMKTVDHSKEYNDNVGSKACFYNSSLKKRINFLLRIRMQQYMHSYPIREFQRLKHLVSCEKEKFLVPTIKNKKGKYQKIKNLILTNREAPEDIIKFVNIFSEYITAVEIFFEDCLKTVRQLFVSTFSNLNSIRIVNWNGGINKSHIFLFDSMRVKFIRQINLTIETTDSCYTLIRRRNPSFFFKGLIHLIKRLRAVNFEVKVLSLFPSSENYALAYIDNLFPIAKLHVATPPRVFMQNLLEYKVPYILLSFVLDSDFHNSNSADDNIDSNDGKYSLDLYTKNEQDIPTLIINDVVTIAPKPIKRGYTRIRKLLTEESKKLQMMAVDSDYHAGYNHMDILSCIAKNPAYGKTPMIRQTTIPIYIPRDVLHQIHNQLLSGCFFESKDHPCITMSSTTSLSDMYRTIIGLREMNVCTLTSNPFDSIRLIANFDSRRYQLVDGSALTSQWITEALFIPWLTLFDAYSTLHYIAMYTYNMPRNQCDESNVLTEIKLLDEGFQYVWVEKDHDHFDSLLIVLMNPNYWNAALAKWVLNLTNRKISSHMIHLLNEKIVV